MTSADTDVEFEAFVRRFEDMVFAIAVRLLGREAEAEDVAQTVFLRAFERFDQLVANPAAGGWLKTVTTNLCLNHLTRYRRRWRLFSELARDGEADDAPDPQDDLAATAPYDFVLADDLQRLETAIAALPDHQRVPLVLFHLQGHSYEHIAALLRVSLGKLKTDMHRGRLALKGAMGGIHAAR